MLTSCEPTIVRLWARAVGRLRREGLDLPLRCANGTTVKAERPRRGTPYDQMMAGTWANA